MRPEDAALLAEAKDFTKDVWPPNGTHIVDRLASRLEQALSTGPAHDAGLIEARARVEAALARAELIGLTVRVVNADLRLILQALAGGGGKVDRIAKLIEGGGPHEWGYRDLTDGTFIRDDAPFDMAEALATQSAQLARMAEALEFYARRDIYEHRGASRYTEAGEDEGAKARDALAARPTKEETNHGNS